MKKLNFLDAARGLLLTGIFACTIGLKATEAKTTYELMQGEERRLQQEKEKEEERLEQEKERERILMRLQARKAKQEMEAIRTNEELDRFVSKYPNITTLTIKEASLSDITPVSKLDHLTHLKFINCPNITNVSPASKLKSLVQLAFNECPQITNITPLGKMITLQNLDLIGCEKLSNIIPLSGLINLKKLYLSYTNINTLNPLKSLAMLKKLAVIGCPRLPESEIQKLKLALPHLKIYTTEE